ncbi:MAG: hypothetical protein NTZ05_07730, partial [Chloroflexi bacterium]|nr:hypothetical protein [Chloroflexota bacterium]
MDDPNAMPAYVANVSRVSEVRRTEGRLGDTFTATYSILGIDFDERFTYVEYDRPRRLVAKFEGGMSGSMGCR